MVFCVTVLHRVSNFTRLSEPVSDKVSYYVVRDINIDVLYGFLFFFFEMEGVVLHRVGFLEYFLS